MYLVVQSPMDVTLPVSVVSAPSAPCVCVDSRCTCRCFGLGHDEDKGSTWGGSVLTRIQEHNTWSYNKSRPILSQVALKLKRVKTRNEYITCFSEQVCQIASQSLVNAKSADNYIFLNITSCHYLSSTTLPSSYFNSWLSCLHKFSVYHCNTDAAFDYFASLIGLIGMSPLHSLTLCF